jgi:hypothetical protein
VNIRKEIKLILRNGKSLLIKLKNIKEVNIDMINDLLNHYYFSKLKYNLYKYLLRRKNKSNYNFQLFFRYILVNF